MENKMSQQIRVRQVKSVITEPPASRKILWALGLRRIGVERTHKDNNCIRGMINKVRHLVSYEIVGK
jgi:large subunit ribosomal protein L30